MPADLKAITRKAIDSLNRGNVDGYLSIYDANVALHGYSPDLPPGLAGAKAFYSGVLAAFPDARITLEDVLVEGDRLACRYTLRATHKGPFMGVPATGKKIDVNGMTVLRFRGETCVERWQQLDQLTLLQQLGVVPPPGQ